MKIKINAKVNLALDIVGVRADGYHALDMIMASVSIGDIMECLPSVGISVVMGGEVCGEENIAYRTVSECIRRNIISGLSVNITKGIPISSGMGGSSCDSAGVLYCVHKFTDCDEGVLMDIAATLGSDVAFLYRGGVARVGGKGEEIAPLPFLPGHLVIGMGQHGALTASVFKAYDKSPVVSSFASKLADNWGRCVDENINGKHCSFVTQGNDASDKYSDNGKNFSAECAGPAAVDNKNELDKTISPWIGRVGNAMTTAAISVNPEIKHTIDVLSRYSGNVAMTGSGAGVLAVFDSEKGAMDCLEKAKSQLAYARYAKLVPCGIEEIY